MESSTHKALTLAIGMSPFSLISRSWLFCNPLKKLLFFLAQWFLECYFYCIILKYKFSTRGQPKSSRFSTFRSKYLSKNSVFFCFTVKNGTGISQHKTLKHLIEVYVKVITVFQMETV